jgi:hypothetical protein
VPSVLGGPLEVVDVDPRHEPQQLAVEQDRLAAERPARDVDDLVEVVGGRGGVELGPEGVHQLLAMELVVRCEREQLDQLATLAQTPDRAVHLLLAARNGEATEQRHGDLALLLDVYIRLELQRGPPDRRRASVICGASRLINPSASRPGRLRRSTTGRLSPRQAG